LLTAFQLTVSVVLLLLTTLQFVGAVSAIVFVIALAVEEAEPPAFVAVNWKSYDVLPANPVIVALVADIAGAVAVVHVVVPATRYCSA